MATQLSVWNDALKILGDHRLITTTDDVEARYALESAWDGAVAFVFQAAFWRFAMKTVSLVHSGAVPALPGYSASFAEPATYYRAHALFVLSGTRECPIDARHQGEAFYATTTPINLRYVDNALVTDPTKWPDLVAKAIAAYLAFDVSSRITQDPQAPQAMFQLWQQFFAAAQNAEAVPANPWLEHQLSGAYMPALRELLEDGFWRFAIKTVDITANVGTPSPGYRYSFTKPADWLRTFEIYEPGYEDRDSLSYRDEGSQFHADYSPVTVRYLSTTLGTDASKWSAQFEEALLAKLALRRALSTPDTAGAVVQALAGVAELKLNDARSNDDMRERPRIIEASRFVRGRFGYGWGRSFREQG